MLIFPKPAKLRTTKQLLSIYENKNVRIRLIDSLDLRSFVYDKQTDIHSRKHICETENTQTYFEENIYSDRVRVYLSGVQHC